MLDQRGDHKPGDHGHNDRRNVMVSQSNREQIEVHDGGCEEDAGLWPAQNNNAEDGGEYRQQNDVSDNLDHALLSHRMNLNTVRSTRAPVPRRTLLERFYRTFADNGKNRLRPADRPRSCARMNARLVLRPT